MPGLVGCPFCRELYTREEAEVCPECGLLLQPIEKLPHAMHGDDTQDWEQEAPEDEPLPFGYWRAGRGVIFASCGVGLVLFFLPWIEVRSPGTESLTGYELMMRRGFWFGGGAVSWVVLAAVVFTRRTLNQMRGARVITTTLAFVTFVQTMLLWVLAPSSSVIQVNYEWTLVFYLSGAVSLFAAIAGAFFGRSPAAANRLSVGAAQVNTANRTLH